MPLIEEQLFETVNLVEKSIARFREFEPPEGYYLAFSGGKDSVVIKRLAEMAGVKYDSHYNVTTIDPPELVRFIREFHPDVEFDQPEIPFLAKLVTTGFPLRQARWCCKVYKEGGGDRRFVVLGIRAAESAQRGNRKMVEICTRRSRRLLHPIIDWTDADVWAFIKQEELPYCGLYDEGYHRLGCLFCPMKSKPMKFAEVKRWPKMAAAFRSAFQRLHDNRKSRGMTSCDKWKDGAEMFLWWLSDDRRPKPKENEKFNWFE